MTRWGDPSDSVFNLLDVNSDRVSYTQDGSEATEDSIVFELELTTQQGYILPSYLQVCLKNHSLGPWWSNGNVVG